MSSELEISIDCEILSRLVEGGLLPWGKEGVSLNHKAFGVPGPVTGSRQLVGLTSPALFKGSSTEPQHHKRRSSAASWLQQQWCGPAVVVKGRQMRLLSALGSLFPRAVDVFDDNLMAKRLT